MSLSRRALLQSSILGGATLVAGAAQAGKSPEHWDQTYDVIVVGSGFAGLAAAIEAKKAGASVIVLDKMPTPGGNSIINGGIMTATGCPQQKKRGIEDSPELLEKDILKAGLYMNDRQKVRVMAEHALENYNWTVNELGVEYMPDAIGQEGGHSVPRYVTTKEGSGAGIVMKELDMCKKLGIPVQLKTYVEKIVRNDDGRVEGVIVRKGYRFPKEGSGKQMALRATRGVVLCYGGFARDVKYRMLQDPKLNEQLDSTNQPGATSELWRETSRIGAMQVQNDWVQSGPWGSPREKGLGSGWKFNQCAAAEYGIWVNSDGKRFINELANRKIRADAIMVELGNGKKCYAICDQQGVDPLIQQRPGSLEFLLENHIVDKYPTLKALAEANHIPYDALKAQIDEFNGYVKNRHDPVWGRYINNVEKPMEKGPWYLGELMPKVHHSMGGLVTDMEGRVMDVITDKPIPGLFAAGESTGRIHGAVRLGSVAILDCLVFGRMAGKAAAENK